MEQNVPGPKQKAKKIIKKDTGNLMMHLDPYTWIYVSLGAGLLQVRNGMNCGCEEVPNNSTLYQTAFVSKSITCLVVLQ